MSERDQAETSLETQHSLRSEELAAQRTALIGRLVALALIVPLVSVLAPWPGPVFTYGLLLVFAALGWCAWWVGNADWGRRWHQYLFVTADFLLLTFTLLYPNPLVPLDYPPQIALRFGSFVYFFVLLAGLAYVYQPRLVLWGGISAAVCWSLGVAWLLSFPDTVWRQPEDMTVESSLATYAIPTFIDIGVRAQEIVVFLIAAGLLALAVRRSRMVTLRQAKLARERENLGRYFPRKTAQMLADRADPFSEPREHKCAVLFADLVAFTSWSEKHTPKQTIDLLREVHGLLATMIFRHDGTLDKFIGDGLMATFGTPTPTNKDASNALAAMIEMVDEFEQMKRSWSPEQYGDLRLSVGVHYGPVVVGNIGTKERLEFAVLGNTVNIASRLETATREVGCRGLVSGDLVDAAQAETDLDATDYRAKLKPHAPIALRGLENKIDVFELP
ncbi:MAG: adenylate/guanylate cyclase domain-containing protein [Pseudomonadota bacterium]